MQSDRLWWDLVNEPVIAPAAFPSPLDTREGERGINAAPASMHWDACALANPEQVENKSQNGVREGSFLYLKRHTGWWHPQIAKQQQMRNKKQSLVPVHMLSSKEVGWEVGVTHTLHLVWGAWCKKSLVLLRISDTSEPLLVPMGGRLRHSCSP